MSRLFTSGGQSTGAFNSLFEILGFRIFQILGTQYNVYTIYYVPPIAGSNLIRECICTEIHEYPGLISFRMDWLDLLAVHSAIKMFINPDPIIPLLEFYPLGKKKGRPT